MFFFQKVGGKWGLKFGGPDERGTISVTAAITKAMGILVPHASRDHTRCPDKEGNWCEWRAPGKVPPAQSKNITPNDISKIEEVFQVFAVEEFLRHLNIWG